MSIQDLPVTGRKTIPAEYQDEMGHMNVMWYTHLFSGAGWTFLSQIGLGADFLKERSSGVFAIGAHVRYLREVMVGNDVTIRTRALGRSASRFHFIHFMVIEESQAVAATCEFVGTHMNLSARRMSAIPKLIRDSFDRLLEKHAQLDWPAPCNGCLKP